MALGLISAAFSFQLQWCRDPSYGSLGGKNAIHLQNGPQLDSKGQHLNRLR